MKKILLAVALVAVVATIVIRGMAHGWFGTHEGPGRVTNRRVPGWAIDQRMQRRADAAAAIGGATDKQILFGDLHVHSTFSPDAFLSSLPLLHGEGAHPPADACDYARYCSALDFWSINDHAEGITPRHWHETIEAIRQCNDVAGDPNDPDVATFLGWEWTQVGRTAATHYGHKNVILRGLGDDEITARPIASRGFAQAALNQGLPTIRAAAIGIFGGDRRYNDLLYYLNERRTAERCPDGVAERDLPRDCMESVATPGELFAKLDDWGVESMVIPHGTTWGFYTPAGSTWDKQLNAEQHDPGRQRLVEIFSGHGNSEEYRDFRAVEFDADGNAVCPEPSPDYLPSCWRAGEIIRERCARADLPEAECDRRAAEARRHYIEGGNAGHLAIPGADATDWLDSGQCRDCFLPSFNYRPGSSVQYMLALRNFAEPDGPDRFRFGFIGSSDNHTARPGTGYKEIDRRENTEATGAIDKEAEAFLRPPAREPVPASESTLGRTESMPAFQIVEFERQASFFMTGGLVAAHATGRDRQSIWDALSRREVYGTSGDRILLWFDLLDEADNPIVPMGGAVEMFQTPRFRVRAVGAFKQKPGCPDDATNALPASRLHHLCRGECYNPSDERKQITRIEVVRIRPQAQEDEPIGDLIDDPWQVFDCKPDLAGCVVQFEDPEFASAGRNTLYYVRAIEEPSPTINAGSLRCERDAEGRCIDVAPCYGDYRTDYEDDCLADSEERAWSSPIFVDHVRAREGA